eukprot:COSAG04_NODE_25891_length_302_cov_0.753695_1_plen_51_part_01
MVIDWLASAVGSGLRRLSREKFDSLILESESCSHKGEVSTTNKPMIDTIQM